MPRPEYKYIWRKVKTEKEYSEQGTFKKNSTFWDKAFSKVLLLLQGQLGLTLKVT